MSDFTFTLKELSELLRRPWVPEIIIAIGNQYLTLPSIINYISHNFGEIDHQSADDGIHYLLQKKFILGDDTNENKTSNKFIGTPKLNRLYEGFSTFFENTATE